MSLADSLSILAVSSNSRTARPLAAAAGPIVAMRRPPRVTTIVPPRSASSSSAAKERLASVAVKILTRSDYLIMCDQINRTTLHPGVSLQAEHQALDYGPS